MVEVVGKSRSRVRRIICGSCASILEYSLSDVQKYCTHYNYHGISDIVYYINCPSCGRKVYVKGY